MRVRTGLDVLEYELRQEQAATIGRLARELRNALDALDTFDRRASSGKTAADGSDPQRARLVDAAAYALWNFVVQRECSGFRWTEQVSQRLRRTGGGAPKDGNGSASLVFEGYVGWGGPSVRSRPASEA
jgi:hypothetical protein